MGMGSITALPVPVATCLWRIEEAHPGTLMQTSRALSEAQTRSIPGSDRLWKCQSSSQTVMVALSMPRGALAPIATQSEAPCLSGVSWTRGGLRPGL